MSICISRHGEYGSHTFGEGSERFICQRCAALDEDAMLAALATAEAEAERLRAEVSDSSQLIWKQAQLLTGVVNAVRGEPGRLELHSHHDAAELVQAVVAERDALSARLQAVRDAAGSLLAALDEQQWCDYGDHSGMTWEDCALVEASEYALRAALDASLGTPGDGLAADLADRRADSEFRQRLTERVAADQHILRRLGTPGDEKPQPREPESMKAVLITQTVAPSERVVLVAASRCDDFVASLDRSRVTRVVVFDPEVVSPDTPGDEKPQPTKRRAAAGGTRLVALTQAANAIRNHRNEERRSEVAGLNAAAEIIDQMIRDGEGFPIGPLGVAPTPIKPVESSGSAE